MPERQRGRPLRLLAAALVAASGAALVAALWLRPLTAEAVLDVLLGAVYLILGIGLLGRSRFSLVLGIVIPGAVAKCRRSGYLARRFISPSRRLRPTSSTSGPS